ncbi:MAG: ribonucleoside-diphosphate reductase subunit alpha [Kiritimatiellae bacterium]|nr:ribonucleoside-diphosphate reductase subunit alpha [Kiritimatiellia bacterium]MDW8459354.1 ribonucleoside-diphosphate reductase subunit alpha [Verrucomicrobiota bacterium]
MATENLSPISTSPAPHSTAEDMPRVIRRDMPGASSKKPRIVPWMGHKIANAVQAAATAVGVKENIGDTVRALIERRVQAERPSFVHIEQIQDWVEDALIAIQQPRVALAYAKYRARRAAEREMAMQRDASATAWSIPSAVSREVVDDLRARLSFALLDVESAISIDQWLAILLRSVSPELSPTDRQKTIILNAKSAVDLEPDARFIAARVYLTYIYEETLPWHIADGIGALKEAHRRAFLEYIPHGIRIGRLDPRMGEFDLARLADAIDPFADLRFDYLGIQTLYDRYLIHEWSDRVGGTRRRMESPQIFWMRVAMGLSLNERDREGWAIRFYDLYKTRRACSSTPTLFNAGTVRPQLSSCYLLFCGDSMEEITETWRRFSMLSKWAGGLGCAWTAVRGSGSYIHGTNGESSGVIPFLKVSNDIALAVNQGGKRPGALCSYLELWHNDIEEFLDLRKETGDERRRTHNMNTAIWIPDLFMKRLQAIADQRLDKDATWTLFRSNEVADLVDLYGPAFEQRYEYYEKEAEAGRIYGRKIRVLALWKKIIEALFETGHPWMTWKDACNIRSPQDHVGVIHSSNLCTEITLNTSTDEVAVCNLASINLAAHVGHDGTIDFGRMRETIYLVMRMLDNVIDLNYYPVDAAAKSNLRHRPVGLGLMGLQDALYALRIPFDSRECVEFNDRIMEFIAYTAYEASSDLAAERGPYETFRGSKWERGLMPLDTLRMLDEARGIPVEVNREARMDWDTLREKIKRQGMRNSNCIAIAPTATISNIMGTTPCIEPTYKHLHTKSNLSGEFVRTNDALLRDLAKRGLWDEEMRSDLRYFDGSVRDIARVPDDLKRLYKTAFEIEPTWILQAAAVRQKWIDQSQSINIFLGDNDARLASQVYREAWRRGLKTTYYLRILNRSGIDSSLRDRAIEARACALNALASGGTCEACQ